MKFQEAITSVINDFGKKILINSSLLNILNDYKAFSEEKHVKNVVKLLSEKGHLETLYNISANDNYSIVINQISHELYNEYGINKDVSHSVLNSIIAGLGLGPVESMVDETLNQNSGFKIDDETQKRLDTYLDLLGASHRECGDLLSKQGKMEDAINFYKLGANRGDSQCLVFLVKLYIENSLVANERDAKDCCNRYFNSFLDVIGDGVPKLSEIEDEILDMYTKEKIR